MKFSKSKYLVSICSLLFVSANVLWISTVNAQQSKDQKELNKEEKNLEKEEKNLEKEAKKACTISYDRRNGKAKKCEPSIYQQALPGIDFEDQDSQVTDEMAQELTKELRKDPNFKSNFIVK